MITNSVWTYGSRITYSRRTLKTWAASPRHAAGTEARLLSATRHEGTERIEHSPAQGSGLGSGSAENHALALTSTRAGAVGRLAVQEGRAPAVSGALVSTT